MERTDIRSLTPAAVSGPVTAITVDVSFISLSKVLPPLLALAADGCWLVALVKPQFEAGQAHVGKGGIVTSPEAKAEAVDAVEALMKAAGWRIAAVIASPIAGRDGNEEFLLGAFRNG
jgi:23S rRNA (cytidine1920-2'-O)/16S rRNA (cytidine1409-2'-O)-methyltransferase